MRLRTILGLSAVMAMMVMAAPPATAVEEVPIPGTCVMGLAGYANNIQFDVDTCVGHEITNCTAVIKAIIIGRFSARNEDASATGGCGETVTTEATVPRLGGKDETTRNSGPGSPMMPCTFSDPGNERAVWVLTCTYTFVEP